MRMREAVGPRFETADFAALFSRLGQPALDPARLALGPVFHYREGVSARPATQHVRRCLEWQYALALPLAEQGFAASGLSEFRPRLLEGQAAQGLFDPGLTCLRERGRRKARGRPRPDSTPVLAALRTLKRLAGGAETLRQALNDRAQPLRPTGGGPRLPLRALSGIGSGWRRSGGPGRRCDRGNRGARRLRAGGLNDDGLLPHHPRPFDLAPQPLALAGLAPGSPSLAQGFQHSRPGSHEFEC